MIKKVAVIPHPDKPDAKKLAKKLSVQLRKRVSIVNIEKAELIFVLGGDGSVLATAPYAARSGAPIVAVNVGRLGFLSELTEKTVFSKLTRFLDEKFVVEERRMLEVWKVEKKGGRENATRMDVALNELLVVRQSVSIIQNISINIGSESTGDFSVDGLIVATPTGSTGHALAAGGPILSPKLRGFLVVPLCPHPPRGRPMVVMEEDIKIDWADGYRDLMAVIDGQRKYKLKPSCRSLRVLPSAYVARFARLPSTNRPSFYSIVRKKLI